MRRTALVSLLALGVACRSAAPACDDAGDCAPPGDSTTSNATSSATPSDLTTSISISATIGSDETSPPVSESTDPSSGSTTTAGTTGPEATETTTGGPTIDPDLALWFTFDDDEVDAIPNSGVLGGVAACSGPTCPSTVAGAIASGASFDGLDDCGVFDAGDLLPSDAELTVTAWIHVATPPNGTAVILGQPYGSAVLNTWDVAVVGDGLTASFIYEGILDAAGTEIASITADLPELGAWTHLAVTHSSDAITLWVDGGLVAQAPGFLLVTDDQPLFLGCDDDHLAMYVLHLDAALDDVRLYERVLTQEEIGELANP